MGLLVSPRPVQDYSLPVEPAADAWTSRLLRQLPADLRRALIQAPRRGAWLRIHVIYGTRQIPGFIHGGTSPIFPEADSDELFFGSDRGSFLG